jgi:hypothetical protein
MIKIIPGLRFTNVKANLRGTSTRDETRNVALHETTNGGKHHQNAGKKVLTPCVAFLVHKLHSRQEGKEIRRIRRIDQGF